MIPHPSAVRTLTIPRGDAGTHATVEQMARLIRAGASWPGLRPLALNIVRGVPDRDFRAQAWAVYNFVSANMRFINDPFGVETLQTVPYMIGQMQAEGNAWGDCDDYTVLFGALFKVLGFPVKIRRVKFEGMKQFSHVIPCAYVRGAGWYEFDATLPKGEVPPVKRIAVADSEVI